MTTERTPIPPNPDIKVMRQDVFERYEARVAAAEELAQAVEATIDYIDLQGRGEKRALRAALEHWREVTK